MFSSDHEGVDWTLCEIGVYPEGPLGSTKIFCGEFAEDGRMLVITPDPDPTHGVVPEPGIYENAVISIMAVKNHDMTQPVGLDIPIKLVVEG